MSTYKITGTRAYRGHEPGETVEMTLTDAEENRAVRRGAIEVIERTKPGLVEGSYKLPKRTAAKRRTRKR